MIINGNLFALKNIELSGSTLSGEFAATGVSVGGVGSGVDVSPPQPVNRKAVRMIRTGSASRWNGTVGHADCILFTL